MTERTVKALISQLLGQGDAVVAAVYAAMVGGGRDEHARDEVGAAERTDLYYDM